MKNSPQELDDLLADLWEELELREQYLIAADEFDAHSIGRRKNIEGRLNALKADAELIKERFLDKPDVFTNFRKRAEEIRLEISEMT